MVGPGKVIARGNLLLRGGGVVIRGNVVWPTEALVVLWIRLRRCRKGLLRKFRERGGSGRG